MVILQLTSLNHFKEKEGSNSKDRNKDVDTSPPCTLRQTPPASLNNGGS
jgi:hypothetical protein